MRHRHGKLPTQFVEPDLPITPMLDMSFQLMAFFIMFFNPTDPEGHLDLALPKEAGGPSATAVPSIDQPDADDLTVKVTADKTGAVETIEVFPPEASAGVNLGNDRKALFAFLDKRRKEKTPGKLRLEMSDHLQYNFVVALIDECTRAGYRQVSPAPMGTTPEKK